MTHTTNMQFHRAYALAHRHDHWWAVKAHPAVWEVARDPRRVAGPVKGTSEWDETRAAAEAAADDAARDARWAPAPYTAPEDIESDAAVLAARASDCVWEAAASHRAAVQAVEDLHPFADGGWIGPQGPEDIEAARAIADSRGGYWGIDYAPESDGAVRHTTCTGRTSWEIDPDGTTTIRRRALARPADDWGFGAELGPVVASARVSPDGSVSLDVDGSATAEDARRMAECLEALGCRRAARRVWLLLDPGVLCAEAERLRPLVEQAAELRAEGASERVIAATCGGTEAALALVEGALRVITTPLGARYAARYDAARENFLSR